MLQICPHDAAPFAGLCERYVQAGAQIGVVVTTVYLAAPSAAALPSVHYLSCRNLADTKSVRAALAAFASESWDVVLCHRYRSYWSAIHSPLAKNMCVVVAHEYGLMSRWQRRLGRRLYASKAIFAGVSAEVAEELRPNTITPAVVLPNVVDVPQARVALVSREEALHTLGLSAGLVNIGVVGRLHYKKRPEVALATFLKLAQLHADIRLVFLGDGEPEAVLAKLSKSESAVARELIEQKRICFAGPVVDAARFFRAFDVLLHPTQIEAFGMVVLEAMIAGVPVVTLPKGGPRFVLGDLGVYAKEDSIEGFVAAIETVLHGGYLRTLGPEPGRLVDIESYQDSAWQRIEQRFSISALAQSLSELLAQDNMAR